MAKMFNSLPEAVEQMLAHARGKPRKFTEAVEMLVTLKEMDVHVSKRFAGTVVLPAYTRANLKVCLLGSEEDCDRATKANIDCKNAADLIAFRKDKKLVKKMFKQYDQFLASESLIRRIPRLLGPSLSKAGKFPRVLLRTDDILQVVDTLKRSVKFQLKKVLTQYVRVGDVSQSAQVIVAQIEKAMDFLVSLLRKRWGNVKSVFIKSSMGPPQRIF